MIPPQAVFDNFEDVLKYIRKHHPEQMDIRNFIDLKMGEIRSRPHSTAPEVSGIGFTRTGFLKFLRWIGIDFEEETNGIYIRISGDSMYLKFDKIYTEHSPEHDDAIARAATLTLIEAILKKRKEIMHDGKPGLAEFLGKETHYLESLRSEQEPQQ